MKIIHTLKLLIVLSYFPFIPLKAARILPMPDLNGKIVLQLDDNEIAIFGYGSLMLLEALENPLYTGPFIQAELSGFKRTWSALYPNLEQWEFEDDSGNTFVPKSITYLNIEPCSNCKVNGMLFIISENELNSYDYREDSYNRIKINDSLLNISVLGGNAYAYTAKPKNHFPTNKNTSNHDTIITQHYVEIIEEALDILGKKFTQEYDNSSQPLPSQLVF